MRITNFATDGLVDAFRKTIDDVCPGFGTVTLGKKENRYWVAEIIGRSEKYRWERKFLARKIDYAHSTKGCDEGVVGEWILESGKYYEVRNDIDRYFCEVTSDGDILRITEDALFDRFGKPTPRLKRDDSDKRRKTIYYAAIRMELHDPPTAEERETLRPLLTQYLEEAKRNVRMFQSCPTSFPGEYAQMVAKGWFVSDSFNYFQRSHWDTIKDQVTNYNYIADIIGEKRISMATFIPEGE